MRALSARQAAPCEADPGVVVGRVLRDRREQLGLSRDRLAARAGYSRHALLSLELAKHSPRLVMVVDVAAALNLTLAEVFRRVDERLDPPGRGTAGTAPAAGSSTLGGTP